MAALTSIDAIQKSLQQQDYIAERSLATTLFLALRMGRPVFLEGEAGVGKTEVAKVLAKILTTELIRLQCYEGLDVNNAVYEWNYARQMLQIRLLEAAGQRDEKRILNEIFGDEFLIRRPLLQAVDQNGKKPPVLLIDELDRADEEFEAFLLELLSDFQVTIPEIGTISAQKPPVVIITSNRTREIHDALKRRCLYFWIDYPSAEKEYQIVKTKVPDIAKALAKEVVAFVQELRSMDLYKLPGVSETLDWSTALVTLTEAELTPGLVDDTLGTLLKYQDDIAKIKGQEAANIVEKLKADSA
ncbi:MoxR family ATPase [bacterium]|nr:MoxR family ATPase [bacterium]